MASGADLLADQPSFLRGNGVQIRFPFCYLRVHCADLGFDVGWALHRIVAEVKLDFPTAIPVEGRAKQHVVGVPEGLRELGKATEPYRVVTIVAAPVAESAREAYPIYDGVDVTGFLAFELPFVDTEIDVN